MPILRKAGGGRLTPVAERGCGGSPLYPAGGSGTKRRGHPAPGGWGGLCKPGGPQHRATSWGALAGPRTVAQAPCSPRAFLGSILRVGCHQAACEPPNCPPGGATVTITALQRHPWLVSTAGRGRGVPRQGAAPHRPTAPICALPQEENSGKGVSASAGSVCPALVWRQQAQPPLHNRRQSKAEGKPRSL